MRDHRSLLRRRRRGRIRVGLRLRRLGLGLRLGHLPSRRHLRAQAQELTAAGGHADPSARSAPLVSVILTTRDRPRLLDVALRCVRSQTYAPLDLLVVDDGVGAPADPARVRDAGGVLVTLDAPTSVGRKLNVGCEQARGSLCVKMDDDDWYSPDFLATLVARHTATWAWLCTPVVSFVAPFLLLDLPRWEVRRSAPNEVGGGSLLFARTDWMRRPFRDLSQFEDIFFVREQSRFGVPPLPVRAPRTYVALRHGGVRTEREHSWTHDREGRPVDQYLAGRPLAGSPESFLPGWALDVYRELRAQTSGSAL
jgi:hypothetical protein